MSGNNFEVPNVAFAYKGTTITQADGKPYTYGDALEWCINALVEFTSDVKGLRAATRIDAAIEAARNAPTSDTSAIVLELRDAKLLLRALSEPKRLGPQGVAVLAGYPLGAPRVALELVKALQGAEKQAEDE